MASGNAHIVLLIFVMEPHNSSPMKWFLLSEGTSKRFRTHETPFLQKYIFKKLFTIVLHNIVFISLLSAATSQLENTDDKINKFLIVQKKSDELNNIGNQTMSKTRVL